MKGEQNANSDDIEISGKFYEKGILTIDKLTMQQQKLDEESIKTQVYIRSMCEFREFHTF